MWNYGCESTVTARMGSDENGGEKLGHGSGGMELLRAA